METCCRTGEAPTDGDPHGGRLERGHVGRSRDDTLRPVGITLSTESVWDDTDIVHILYDEVRVSNLHVEGGLRLQSSPNESLVVKMSGPGVLNDAYNRNPTIGAGFTATGQTSDTSDRIGGTLYVLGQPGFPVVLTSIHDDTVGAGVQPDGQPQKDTNNNRSRSTPQSATGGACGWTRTATTATWRSW